MSALNSAAIYTGIGSVVGGVGGLFVGAPLDGMKVGGALGMQVAAQQQNAEIKREFADKAKEGIDGAGRKMSQIADTANNAVNNMGNQAAEAVGKIGHVAAMAILDVSQKFSALMLVSYAFSIVNTESNLSEAFYLANCQYALQNVVCASRAFKNLTLTNVSISIAVCLAMKTWESFIKKKGG